MLNEKNLERVRGAWSRVLIALQSLSNFQSRQKLLTHTIYCVLTDKSQTKWSKDHFSTSKVFWHVIHENYSTLYATSLSTNDLGQSFNVPFATLRIWKIFEWNRVGRNTVIGCLNWVILVLFYIMNYSYSNFNTKYEN